MDEEEKISAPTQPSAGTAIQMENSPPSSNAAIVICGGEEQDAQSEVAAKRFLAFLTSDPAGSSPENVHFISQPKAVDSTGSSSSWDTVVFAFRQLFEKSGSTAFLPDGKAQRKRLWVYAAGFGIREPNGRIMLIGNPSDLALSDLIDQVRETGLFEEVIFIADLLGNHSLRGSYVTQASAIPSKRLPPATSYCYLISSLTDAATLAARSATSFTDFVVDGLLGKATDAEGNVTSRSLFEYARRQMESVAPRANAVTVQNSANEIVFRGGTSSNRSDEQVPTVDAHISPASSDRRIGGRLRLTREADDGERCLNVEDYAEAAASLFTASHGEFCFALYGRWGRGKTFLMEQIAGLLQRSDYLTIRLSAWKYPTTPEVWIHLYEQFAQAAFTGSLIRTTPAVIRSGIEKRGMWGLLYVYLALAISLFPLFDWLEWGSKVIAYVYPLLGVMGIVWVAQFVWSIKHTNERLTKTYLSVSRHTEKLGLQATIGNDLSALLKGWIPNKAFDRSTVAAYWLITAILIGATLTRLSTGQHLQESLQDHFNLRIFVSAPQVAMVIIAVTLIVLAYVISRWISSTAASPKRILLIVDDLDRCAPEHLLSVMESIKLLVEDPEISSRVQVAMLIEEDILGEAILNKYRSLTKESSGGMLGILQKASIVRENCEKLFLVHLRLPGLSKSEVRDLVEAFSGQRNRRLVAQRERRRKVMQELRKKKGDPTLFENYEAQLGRTKLSTVLDLPNTDGPAGDLVDLASAAPTDIEFLNRVEFEAINQALPESDRIPPRATDSSDVSLKVDDGKALSDSEVDAIQEALKACTTIPSSIGPRTIRALLFRYQLARLLLLKLKISWNDRNLADALVAASFSTHQKGDAGPIMDFMSDEEKMTRVVAQVS